MEQLDTHSISQSFTEPGHGSTHPNTSTSTTMCAVLLERYGPLLSTEALADLLGYATPKQVTNALASGRLDIPTAKLAGRRQARVQDVAAFIDRALEHDSLRVDDADMADPYAYYARWAD